MSSIENIQNAGKNIKKCDQKELKDLMSVRDFNNQQYLIANIINNWGFVVIPLEGKISTIKKWQTYDNKIGLQAVQQRVYFSNSYINIGVLTGKPSNIIVVDIDNKNDGLIEWEKLCKKYGKPNTFTIKSGSGGYHYYFKYTESVSKFRNKIKSINNKGIDLKTTGGYVVFPFSVHPETKNYYSFENFELSSDTSQAMPEMIDMPEWLIEELSANEKQTEPKKSKKSSAVLTEKVNPESSDIKYEVIEDMVLNHLSINRADNRDDWMRIIWLLKNISDTTEYFNLAHKFSQRVPGKYDEKVVTDLWTTGSRDKRLSIGTLFYYLRADVTDEIYSSFRSKYNITKMYWQMNYYQYCL